MEDLFTTPGARNECHRHAHESIFVVLKGQGELRLGSQTIALKTGDVACLPRWVVHQSRNYDRRTRLKDGGVDAFVGDEPSVAAGQ